MAASNDLDRQVEYGTEITGGYIDHSGEFVIPARFKYADEFLDDLVRVCVADKVGYIDRTGTYIIPRDLEVAVRFSEGLAAFRVTGKWGYTDKQGREVVAPQFDRANEFSNGIARVQMRTKKNDGHTNDGYIDESGNYQSAGSPAPRVVADSVCFDLQFQPLHRTDETTPAERAMMRSFARTGGDGLSGLCVVCGHHMYGPSDRRPPFYRSSDSGRPRPPRCPFRR